jgi:tetratricopeptide (TPR) repeat protein
LEPQQARWVYNLGVIYREQGKEELAAEQFRRAFEINPELDFYYRPSEETEALSGAAYRKYQQGDYRGAIDLYRQALLNDAFYLPARFNLALAYQADKQMGRAHREYERLLRIEPDNIPTHLNLGIALYQQDRRSPQAAYHLRRYLELNPQSRQAQLIRRYLREIRDW